MFTWPLDHFPYLCALTQGVGNEPKDSLRGNQRGWFIGVIPSFPAYRTSKLFGFPYALSSQFPFETGEARNWLRNRVELRTGSLASLAPTHFISFFFLTPLAERGMSIRPFGFICLGGCATKYMYQQPWMEASGWGFPLMLF